MRHAVNAESLQCSATFVRPFMEVLANGQPFDENTWERLGVESHSKLPVQKMYELLSQVIDQTHDPHLGLKAAERMGIGDVGVLDYLMSTAPTVGDALGMAARYFVLLNESLACRLELSDGLAAFRFEPYIPPPPAAEDFVLSAMFHNQSWLARLPELECCFLHPPPDDQQPYTRAFGDAKLRFSAEYTGFVFPRGQLLTPLSGADRNLHAVVRELADIMLAQYARRSESFTERVQAVLAYEVGTPSLKASCVARHLQTSGRTLARKLEAEGTSFYALLDDARKHRALELMADNDRSLTDIARATGFAHVASFHRAFRRWTGQTPAEFRTRAATLMQ